MTRCDERAPWRGHRQCDMDHEQVNVELVDGYRVHGYRSSRRHGLTVTWLTKPKRTFEFGYFFINPEKSHGLSKFKKGTIVIFEIDTGMFDWYQDWTYQTDLLGSENS